MPSAAYTPSRARALNKFHVPTFENALGARFLWIDALTASDFESRVYTGATAHSHSFLELHFVARGSITYECGEKTVILHEGEALLFPAYTMHRYLSNSKDVLKLSTAVSADTVLFLGNALSPHPFSVSDSVKESLRFLLENAEKSDPFTPVRAASKLFEILECVLCELHISIPEKKASTSDPRLPVARHFIEQNTDRLLSCEDVARECCLSVKQLGRIFKQDTGQTLFEAIVDAKLKKAEKLILEEERSIKETAFMLGFRSESGFVSYYKRHTGVTPGALKNQEEGQPS